ncbi:2-oxoacid:acceptor oxidoreductase family protein [Candidatus Sumerlaeota bacterium]|nr:2-oxoacid:acceptor oxidoreductase family protein [Candidatus Sumerlaeota bacterium]
MTAGRAIDVVVGGLGGQGVLKASDILAEVVFSAGFDVKKSEIHGMSQRGGSVTSDVRFGQEVLSPMVPEGEADYLVVLAADQIEPNRHLLREGGTLLEPSLIDAASLASPRGLNVALLGALSVWLEKEENVAGRLSVEAWENAIRSNLAPKIHDQNLEAFAIGRRAAAERTAQE